MRNAKQESQKWIITIDIDLNGGDACEAYDARKLNNKQ